MFAKGKSITLDLPRVRWDTGSTQIFTHSLDLRFTKTPTHPLMWEIEFIMTDDNGLGDKKAVYTMYIFYSIGYPSSAPQISIREGVMGPDGKVQKGKFVTAPHHTLGSETIDGVSYKIACHYNHNSVSATQGHDPSRTNTVMHATKAIRWLRAALYYQKRGDMPDQ